uniref:Uncharacterized protein n=1 Tax=Anguilla anguilla TaxID=7936 RepID=A0A0E9SFG0_ANGAN
MVMVQYTKAKVMVFIAATLH